MAMAEVEFDIPQIADILHLNLHSRAGKEYIYFCPFCGTTEKEYPKLYINPRGIFICHHCHREGSITELWAVLCQTDTKTAWKQITTLSGRPTYQREEIKPREVNVDRLDAVYREFLRHLSLSYQHKQDLLRRGLPESKTKEFKSLPEDKSRWDICRYLDKKYGLQDIPGFRQQTSKNNKPYWDCIHSGMLIPVQNVYQKITGFQVRTGGDPKYIWFSYAGQTKASAHIVPGRGVPWIIEGVLKAYMANYFLNMPCIGIPGTGTWKTALQYIKGGKIVVCYDNEINKYTLDSRDKLVAHLKSKGFQVSIANWPTSLGKGIDDACLTMLQQGRTPKPDDFISGVSA